MNRITPLIFLVAIGSLGGCIFAVETELRDHDDDAGLVICRQRPATASGVIFMTLEDETGLVNLVIFPKITARYPVLVRTQSFLGISGRIQNQEGVTHLIADHLWTPKLPNRPAKTSSRDFY